MPRPLGIVSFVVLALLVGCQRMGPIKPSEVQGKWFITPESCNPLNKGQSFASSEIVLLADGKSEIHGIPWTTEPEAASAKPMNGNGEWKLISGDGVQKLSLITDTTLSSGSTQKYGFPLEIGRSSSHIYLFYYIGDPDNGEKIEFLKR